MSTSSATRAVSTPDKWPSSEHFEETVTLIVGWKKICYTLHKGLLCFYSDYFRAAFEGGFKEASERAIEVPDVKQEVFKWFQVWLYTRRFPCSGDKDESDEETVILAKLWIFGDKYQIPFLQNCAMNKLLAIVDQENVMPLEVVDLAYEYTPPASALRKAAVGIVATSFTLDRKAGNAFNAEEEWVWSVESLIDLIQAAQAERKPHGRPPVRHKCFFHVHEEGEHC